jgi:hypothetical protein
VLISVAFTISKQIWNYILLTKLPLIFSCLPMPSVVKDRAQLLKSYFFPNYMEQSPFEKLTVVQLVTINLEISVKYRSSGIRTWVPMPKHHTIQVYGGVEGKLYVFITDTRCRQVLTSCSGSTLWCTKRKLGRPQVKTVAVRKHHEPARNQTSVVKPITCHFTEPS